MIKSGRRWTVALVILVGMASAAAGCNSRPASPTNPSNTGTAPLAPVLSVAIEPAIDVLTLGRDQQLRVRVELGPGVPPSGPVPLWSTSNPGVVAVNSSGVVTGRAIGDAVVEVIFQGHKVARG